MTAEQVAKNFQGECKGVNSWCDVHDSCWAFRVSAWCNRLTDWIDIAEQSVEAYQADLRARLEGLPDQPSATTAYRLAIEDVLALLDGGSGEY